jgi:putative aminopeptidase FrvX
MPIPDLLRELLCAFGPTGHEGPAARVWRKAAEAFAVVDADSMGTSYARVRGASRAPTLAVVGHIDEIGFAVTHIEENGLLAFSSLGRFPAATMAAQRVVVAGREGPVRGVVGRRESSGRESRRGQGVEIADLYIDIGAADSAEAAELVRPGDAGVWEGPPEELRNGRFVSKALDNRLGAYVALEAARRMAEAGDAPVDVVAVAAVQEEIGHHGARTAAYSLQPDVALAIDVTWSTDVPGRSPRDAGRTDLGGGPAVTRGPVVHPLVFDLLAQVAAEEAIPHAFDVYTGRTQTDADDLHVSRGGVPTGLISIPIRNMHSPIEVGSLDDVEAAVGLVAGLARRLGPETSFLR